MNWTFNWPWLVVVLAADGSETVRWRCESRQQAMRERDRILDDIMAGTATDSAAWITHQDTDARR